MNNILIVDDKSENLYLLELMLAGGGFTTVSARNGAEALVLARQALPALIISDILMPIMDGFTLCRELKKDRKLKNIPFIFYTATYTDPKDEEFALSLGADRFLLKPLDIPDFIATIKVVLTEAKQKNIRKIEPPSSSEVVILKEYNEALVRKLEDKMVQIEHAEKEVRKYNIALLREIEERKQYAEALRESEIKYRAFFENSMDSILLTSPDGRIFSANPAACSMFGYPEEELIKLGRSGVVDSTDPRLSLMLEERTLTGKVHGELTFTRKDGTHFPAEISSAIFNDHEGLENTSMIIRDITERKHTEKELIEAKEKAEQSNKMKDAFIANISHEIRTPLNGILGMTSIIQEIYSPNITSEEERYFAAIRKSSDRIIRTIDLILNYSQLKTGTFIINPKQVELSSLCEEVTNHFITAAKSKALSLSFQNDLGKTFILADGYSIKQVIYNLLENAIIYTQNGFVKVRLYKSEQDEILLDVIDSGIGIGGEYLDHIFESYRQEKMGYSRPYEGLGLGLAVVKQILSLHNAGISVKSKKGEGTTFTINFSEHTQTVEEKISIQNNSAKVKPLVGKSNHLVLLVEDDELNQDIIRKYIIRKYDCIVTASYDGVMELLHDHKVDLIVMDIALRESLNGLEITKKLKASKKYKHIPVIAATAHAFEHDRKAVMEAGCDDYLAKPFTKDQLFYKIDKFLQ
ncbi:MAG: response regulator [Ignavibacteriaceae bacterium]|jgi:PAS domain S-box-containing protein